MFGFLQRLVAGLSKGGLVDTLPLEFFGQTPIGKIIGSGS